MELSWLEDFLALVEEGHFGRAADRRHVTQPAFSRRIQSLEAWMGAALFDRHAQPVVLTEAGGRLLPVAGEVLRRLERLRTQSGAATGTLRLAATHVLSVGFVPHWLRSLEFGAAQPRVHLVSDSLLACERLMRRGEVEFLLCHRTAQAPGGLAGPDYIRLAVGVDRLCAVAAAGAGADAPALAYSAESGLGQIVRAAGREPPEPALTSHLAQVLHSVARSGGGVAWLPESLVGADLASGRLVRQPLADIPVEICLIRPAHGLPGPVAEAFWRLSQAANAIAPLVLPAGPSSGSGSGCGPGAGAATVPGASG